MNSEDKQATYEGRASAAPVMTGDLTAKAKIFSYLTALRDAAAAHDDG